MGTLSLPLDQDLLRNPEDTIESLRGSTTPPLQEDYKVPSSNSLFTKPHSRASSSLHVSSVPVPSTTSLNAGQSVYISPYSELRQSSHSTYNMSSYGTATCLETRSEPHRYAHPYTNTSNGGENAGSYMPHMVVHPQDYHNLTNGPASQHDYVASHRDYYPGLTGASSSY